MVLLTKLSLITPEQQLILHYLDMSLQDHHLSVDLIATNLGIRKPLHHYIKMILFVKVCFPTYFSDIFPSYIY